MKDLGALLRLTRPFIELDLETTGTVYEQDRIIQIGVTVFRPESQPTLWKTFVDPEMPIPAEIQHKVKITDADVAGAPTFRSLAPVLARKFTGVDFGGYNVDFDLRFLKAGFKREGVEWSYEEAAVVDSQKIYFRFNPRTLSDAYREYGGEGGRPLPADHPGLEGAHDAGNDVEATVDVLAGQLLRHPECPRTVPELAAFCFPKRPDWVDKSGKIVWRGHEACVGFGKNNGTPLRACDKGYLQWMLKSDFPSDTKAILEKALRGEYPKKLV